MKVDPVKIHLGLNETGARILHRLLKAEFQKGDVDDETLRTWFRLDNAMKRAGVSTE